MRCKARGVPTRRGSHRLAICRRCSVVRMDAGRTPDGGRTDGVAWGMDNCAGWAADLRLDARRRLVTAPEAGAPVAASTEAAAAPAAPASAKQRACLTLRGKIWRPLGRAMSDTVG